MKEKACANIEAAKLLNNESFFDSCVSRSYYAVYLFAWYFLLRLKIHPPHATKDGRNYWRHDLFPQMLCEDKFINPDQMDEWEWLYYLRIRADYYEEKIEKADADESIRLAYQLIVHFQNEELRADD